MADEAPVALEPLLSQGLGYACDQLARWVEESVSDSRGVDTVIRFYGLDRLPEELSEIGHTLPRLSPAGLVRPDTVAGVTTRQVQNILRSAVEELEDRPLPASLRGDDRPLPQFGLS